MTIYRKRETVGRAYDNSGRTAAARETRSRILDAARAILLDGGYPSMTVASLARTAGVSPQTVYNSVGGKAAVVKAVYDVSLATDDEPVPMSERAEFLALRAARTPAQFLTAYVAWCRLVYDRIGPLLAALGGGWGNDPELAEFFATLDAERRTGTERAMTALFGILGRRPGTRAWRRVVDAVWTLNSPAVHTRLVVQCGWSAGDYEAWLHDQIRVATGAPDDDVVPGAG